LSEPKKGKNGTLFISLLHKNLKEDIQICRGKLLGKDANDDKDTNIKNTTPHISKCQSITS
jgi:hypothetical protein